MTGEITLRGRILPVGGVREKVLAAHRAGLKTVVLPKRNMKDLIDMPKRVKKEVNIVPVEHMDEVLGIALGSTPAKTKSQGTKRRKSPRKEATESSREIPPKPTGGGQPIQPGL